MDNRPIGIFDSGVGGLSIFLEIERLLPREHFIYVADQKHVPYGGKTKTQLERLARAIVSFLAGNDVKMVVVACNTATVYTIDYLRKNFSLPIVGVVPVIKTLVEITKNNKVAVMSTPATSKSPYLKQLIDRNGGAVQVFNIDGNGLEELVEEGYLDSPEVKKLLKVCLTPLVEKEIDALALGCTHYPFLRKEIVEIVGPEVTVLDSGGAVARQVRKILENNQALSDKIDENRFFTTGDVLHFSKVASRLLALNIEAKQITLPVTLT